MDGHAKDKPIEYSLTGNLRALRMLWWNFA